MQSHDPIQIGKDSSQPIVIPGAQDIAINESATNGGGTSSDAVAPSTSNSSHFAPDSFQTARSFKNSPIEYPFSTSTSSTHSNGRFMNNITGIGNSVDTSPTSNFSPRFEAPGTSSFSEHRNSITDRSNNSYINSYTSQQQQDSSARRNLLSSTSKFNSASYQIPSYQQLHQQQTQFQNNNNIPSPQPSSSFQGSSSFFNRSSNVPIQQPSFQPNLTSSHFQTNLASYTPYHNAPSVVSSSYSSSTNSVPNHLQTYPNQHQFDQPTVDLIRVKTERGGFDNLPDSKESQNSSGGDVMTTVIAIDDEDNDANMSDSPTDHKPPSGSLLTSSLGTSASNEETSAFKEEEVPAQQPEPESGHLDIVNHSTEDLLHMLSALLQKIIEANDNLHPNHYAHASQSQQEAEANLSHHDNKFTANVLAFHGRNVPAISIHAYLSRILKYCPVTNEVFLTLLVYFDRIAKRANAGDFNTTPVRSEEEGHVNDVKTGEKKPDQLFVMDSYNIHRLIIAGITVASKFFSDIFYKNSRYAKVGGLPLDELNHLEIQFLLLTDFKLLIQTEELQRYADLLLKFWVREQSKAQ